jgi:hypothetical protein
MTVECNNVVFHLQSDSYYEGHYFQDKSINNWPITRSGNTTHSLDTNPYNNTQTSVKCDSGKLSVGHDSTSLDLIHQGASDWTIQFWIKPDEFDKDSPSNQYSPRVVLSTYQDTAGFTTSIEHAGFDSGGNQLLAVCFKTFDNGETVSMTSGQIDTGWHHVLIAYDSQQLKFEMFVDGVQSNSNVPWLKPAGLRTSDQTLKIGTTSYISYFQDIQIVNKLIHDPLISSFTLPVELLPDVCAPSKINLHVPGRPNYIYYFDGTTTKCYRRVNQVSFDQGISLTTDQIATSIEDFEANKDSKPVLLFDSCEACLGVGEYYQFVELQANVEYGLEVDDLGFIYFPDNNPINVDIYTLNNTLGLTVDLALTNSFTQMYGENPIELTGQDIYTVNMTTYQRGLTVDISFDTSTGRFEETPSDITNNTETQVEGMVNYPGVSPDGTFQVINNPGDFVALPHGDS